MGCEFFFDEVVSLDNNTRVSCVPQQVEVLDNHSVPEIVVCPVGAAHLGLRVTFNDWKQFESFVESVNALRNRLSAINE